MGNMIFNQHQIWAPHVQLSLLYHLLPIWKEIKMMDYIEGKLLGTPGVS